jgi:hypothetical protein
MRKVLSLAALVGLIAVASSAAIARGGPRGGAGDSGATTFSPGHQFRQGGAVTGYRGASGYAPGRLYRANRSVTGYPGASAYAPGHKFKHR